LVCTSIATAHRITQFRVVELFETEKRTVTPIAKPAQATVVRRPQATCRIDYTLETFEPILRSRLERLQEALSKEHFEATLNYGVKST
jgi:hypothetical protein